MAERRWQRPRALLAEAAGQSGLFSKSPRRSDPPATSRQARAKVLANGSAQTQCAKVLRYVIAHPGCTRRELADYLIRDGVTADLNMPARRLSELERLGLVKRGGSRRCKIGGMLAETWLPQEGAGARG
jgi:hypothetical protein